MIPPKLPSPKMKRINLFKDVVKKELGDESEDGETIEEPLNKTFDVAISSN